MAADDAILSGPASNAVRRLQRLRTDLNVQMQALLRRISTKGGKIDKEQLANARAIKMQVLALLRERGAPVVIDESERSIHDAVELALRAHRPVTQGVNPTLPQVSTSFEAEVRRSAADSVDGLLDEVADLFDEAAQEMRVAIDRGLNTSAPLDDVIEDVAARLDTTFTKASAAVDLAVRGAAQKAIIEQAERGAEAVGAEVAYVYTGANVDTKTRDFCRATYGRAFTRDAMRRLKNDAGLPVETARGGFNCRHFWAVADVEALEAQGIEVER